jgi:holo-[acyl-carrier protein] synthase
MIYGVGIDMVEVSRIDKAMKRWGDRFLNRVFTEGEIEYCHRKAEAPSRYALRFAAKEAFSKAIGLGFRDGLRFRDIEVIRHPSERPCLSLHARARELWESRGLKNSALSLSDDGLYAVAIVLLEE